MRLFMVRRTRSFIRENYAFKDQEDGRQYLLFPDGRREAFPDRVPRRAEFDADENDPRDQYARMYSDDVVETINALNLPRYGLGNYVKNHPAKPPTPHEQKLIDDLPEAGGAHGLQPHQPVQGLESSGYAFLLSVEHHILRNYVFIHALENGLLLPIGTQGCRAARHAAGRRRRGRRRLPAPSGQRMARATRSRTAPPHPHRYARRQLSGLVRPESTASTPNSTARASADPPRPLHSGSGQGAPRRRRACS